MCQDVKPKTKKQTINHMPNLDLMGGLYRCIVACSHLGNGTGRRTVTMHCSLSTNQAKFEAGLHRKYFSINVRVY